MQAESTIEKTETDSRSSRRKFLERAGLVGAGWAVPSLISFDTPAFGAVAATANKQCASTSFQAAGGVCGLCAAASSGCAGNGTCACHINEKGCCFCGANAGCGSLPVCTKTKTCPAGWQCVKNCCDTSGATSFCQPPCGAAVAAVARGTLSSNPT